ncbi:MAG TPA: guanylate kinase [Candidatus Moranbacteria bacterium]|nr:guanylate kinase [Candidatus Moranbacteria bacterium]
MKKGENLFIISGPSGAGEDSIIEGIGRHCPIERVITTTTRPPRRGESRGNPYYFVSREEFLEKVKKGLFAEYERHYNDNYYGVTREELERVAACGKIGIWKLEYKGVLSAKKLFPSITAIMITVPDLETLRRRILKRDPTVGERYLRERMEYSRRWMDRTDIYDYVVVNADGKLSEAIEETVAIISSKTDLCSKKSKKP